VIAALFCAIQLICCMWWYFSVVARGVLSTGKLDKVAVMTVDDETLFAFEDDSSTISRTLTALGTAVEARSPL
jgi:hypothetical protein